MVASLLRWRAARCNYLWFRLTVAYTKPEYGGDAWEFKWRHLIKAEIEALEQEHWAYGVALQIITEEALKIRS